MEVEVFYILVVVTDKDSFQLAVLKVLHGHDLKIAVYNELLSITEALNDVP